MPEPSNIRLFLIAIVFVKFCLVFWAVLGLSNYRDWATFWGKWKFALF